LALLWAILMPVIFLPVLEAASGIGPVTRLVHRMARDLRSALPKEPAGGDAMVNLPAQDVSNTAGALDWAGKAIDQVLGLRNFDTAVSSVAIIILSICVLWSGKRDRNTAT
jgi:hypothetical protein